MASATATKSKKSKAKAEAPVAEATSSEFGVKDVIKLIKAHPDYKPGKRDIQTKDVRNLIRKMARDGSARVNRKVVPGNKTPYNWPKGEKDPEVQAIVEAWVGGEYEQVKQEKLSELKAQGAQKRAAKKAASASTGDDDDELEEADVEDDDEAEDDDED
jgi:hypothetical protein